jgi:hypothetical protein
LFILKTKGLQGNNSMKNVLILQIFTKCTMATSRWPVRSLLAVRRENTEMALWKQQMSEGLHTGEKVCVASWSDSLVAKSVSTSD